MGSLFGDTTFEDVMNAPEVLIQTKAIPAWEKLEGDLIRIFVCKEIGDRLVLDHTDIMTRATMIAIGKRFLEIADVATRSAPSSADVRTEGIKLH